METTACPHGDDDVKVVGIYFTVPALEKRPSVAAQRSAQKAGRRRRPELRGVRGVRGGRRQRHAPRTERPAGAPRQPGQTPGHRAAAVHLQEAGAVADALHAARRVVGGGGGGGGRPARSSPRPGGRCTKSRIGCTWDDRK